VAIEAVQDLLDHKHITTTQIYDKRRRSVRDSASHQVPIEAFLSADLRPENLA
jgi:site-specific recombinase XerD